MSYGVQSAGLFGSLSVDGSTSTSLRPFANLNLTEDQRAQVRSILKNAKSEGLTQNQIEQEINSILTPTQQTTFQNDQASVSSSSSSSSSDAASASVTQSSSTQPNPFTDANGPFANLDLTSSQQSQVSQILSDAQSEGLTFSQVNSQISSILTTTQQTSFESDLASLPSAGGNSSQSGGSSSTSSNPASSVQQQIAAAAALILQQIEQDISNQSSTSSSSGSGSSTQSTQNAQNPFADPNGPFANLNLTQDQQTQIAQILSSAQSQGLTFDQINSQINGVLTSSQQSAFSSDLANLPTSTSSSGSSASAASNSPSSGLSIASIQQQIEAAAEAILQQIEQSAQTTSSNSNSSSTATAPASGSSQSSQSTFSPFTDPNGPFANLNLTSDQQSQISQILSEAQSQGLTPEQVNSQISGLLSTTQQATFSSDLASLQLPTSSHLARPLLRLRFSDKSPLRNR